MTAQTEAGRLNLPNIERKQGGKRKGSNETHSGKKKTEDRGSAEAGGAEEA